MSSQSRASWMMWCFAAMILVSAFLVFQIQPIISKTILPWFGGSPAVWTTCMLFFQVVLFGGYAYAHLLTRLTPYWQGIVYFLLVIASLLVLPIAPDALWKPTGAEDPTWRIIVLLLLNIGIPYFLLSSTGPLIQAWFSRTCQGKSLYRLYALSNVGFLAALLTYPFLAEPALTTNQQSRWWSLGFCVFTLLCGYCAVKIWRLQHAWSDESVDAFPDSHQCATAGPQFPPPTRTLQFWWLLLPAFASVMLLATTNHICQDVAVIPFLWILPLSLYLLTFILSFGSQRWYSRRRCAWGALVCILGITAMPAMGYLLPHILMEVAIYFSALFFVCMLCHGELVARRPSTQYLTRFYLMSSGGGALGGFLVAVICPFFFSNYFEMNLALLIGFVMVLAFVFKHDRYVRMRTNPRWSLMAGVLGFVGLLAVIHIQLGAAPVRYLASTRNFYGVLSVLENQPPDPALRGRALVHGRILHGFQHRAAERSRETTKYYARETGAGLAFRRFPRQGPLKVGVIGLGVKTVAAYGQDGDYFRFYEINPDVVDLAQEYFSFHEDSHVTCDIVLGDARLMLEREKNQNFDIFILDAFSSDAVPTHLLTREAFAVYLRHLKPQSILTANISNRHVNLCGVFTRLAKIYDLGTVDCHSQSTEEPGSSAAHWITATRNREFLTDKVIRAEASESKQQYAQLPIWTDEYSNLLWILR